MNIPTYLECTPMTPQQVCICCHAVRYCKGCCRTCKNDCNSRHDCEFDSFPEGHDCTWWNGVVTCMNRQFDERDVWLPDNLIKYMDKKILNK